MEFIELIDPFLMQLFILPLIVIGLGVLVSILAKKVFLAPLITLLLNTLYETWYMNHYYPDNEVSYNFWDISSSWNIIFSVISLIISFIVVKNKKEKNKSELN